MRNKLQILHIILCVIFLASCSNSIHTKKDIPWINFNWVGDSIGDRYYNKLAIKIPFKFSNTRNAQDQFTMQFDLGATYSRLYGNSYKSYINKAYPQLKKKFDTSNLFRLKNKSFFAFKNINFQLDNIWFYNRDLVLFEGYGRNIKIDSTKSIIKENIGTIGSDIVKNKILLIDFPNDRFVIFDSLPSHIKKNTSFVDCRLDNNRIKVPVTIENNTYDFMFDTGASMFSLVTSMKTWDLLRNKNSLIDTIPTSTWGKKYNILVSNIAEEKEISIGNFKLNNLMIYGNPLDLNDKLLEEENIEGIMGNALFFDQRVIIDYKTKSFGVVRSDYILN